jgi:ribosomal protein S21
MVRETASLENEGLRWFRRALATERLIDAVRARAPEDVSELRPRPRAQRVRSSAAATVSSARPKTSTA